jgi:hypothetical protein
MIATQETTVVIVQNAFQQTLQKNKSIQSTNYSIRMTDDEKHLCCGGNEAQEKSPLHRAAVVSLIKNKRKQGQTKKIQKPVLKEQTCPNSNE